MYSLDVNFLKDRHIETVKTPKKAKRSFSSSNRQLPIILGGAALVLLPALAGGLGFLLNYESGKAQENIQALDSQLRSQKAQDEQLNAIEDKIKGVEGELQSLMGVFDRIKPWSAVLREVSRQIPALVGISTITQDNQSLILEGHAVDYGNLNDFLLNLQNSKFLKSEQTQLVSATFGEYVVSLTKQAPDPNIALPKVVNFSIKTELSDIPSSDLQRELASNGAVGLLSRIQTLKTKGILKP